MKFQIYKSLSMFLAQPFRWKITAANNERVSASSEGFYSEQGARDNAELTRQALNAAHAAGQLTKGRE